MNDHPLAIKDPLAQATLAEACNQAMTLIASGQHQAAWRQLQTLAEAHPQHAPIYRLQGGILQQSGQWDAALVTFRQALDLAPEDSQAHTGAARCLLRQGALPAALAHFRAALHCQCQQPKQATAPPAPPPFDTDAAEVTLWRVLALLAQAGVHAFPTSGTLLGLVREGRLLPFDKDLDIGLPFGEMDKAASCLEAAGWRRVEHMAGLVTPTEWHGHGLALDLCGFSPDPTNGKVISGFWYEDPNHPWSRVTEFPELQLRAAQRAEGSYWELADPETVLVSLYGKDWRVPDPDFDTVLAARNMRGCSLVTQCYAFARIYSTWLLGRTAKTRALVRYTLAHLPEDELLLEVVRVLALQPETGGKSE